MNSTPTASYNNLEKTLKGLRAVVPSGQLHEALIRHGLNSIPTRARVPLTSLNALLEELAQRTQDPLLLINAFSQLDYSPALLRKSYLASAATLRDAIALTSRYCRVDTEVVQLQLSVRQGRACVILRGNPAAPSRMHLDAMLYGVMRTLVSLGLRGEPQLVLPAGSSAELQRSLAKAFCAPVVCEGDDHSICFPAIELARVLNWSGDAIDKAAQRERQLIRLRAGEHNWSGSVATLLRIGLRRGETSLAGCAHWLAVSGRTLQRRLQAENSEFTDLVDHCRRQLSEQYLQAGYSNDSIALLLGYRQSAQYFRSFRRWHGMSPAVYARNHQITNTHNTVTCATDNVRHGSYPKREKNHA
ncbi:AraC family transcriptional regulator [Halopseudomonas sp.]|uniref:AraC family transcriptional regulator n=1 Tax=Halopseudomonas sp. TaxID=2901191 RepID=UPI003001FF23